MTETALEASHLFKVFGRNPAQAVRRLKVGESRDAVQDAGTAAVIDASFTVERGEIFVIMGLSGSGKSTIIRMLNGLHDATDGTVTIGGDPITGNPRKNSEAPKLSESVAQNIKEGIDMDKPPGSPHGGGDAWGCGHCVSVSRWAAATR